MAQADIDKMNSEFWNELCGSGLAKALGLTDHSPESLRKFDDAYFAIYPYFLPLINPARTAGKDVLEIGLGYGSLSQKLAEEGARYHGLDIAANAARMVNWRMQALNCSGKAVQGSALEMPFPDASFDFVFSIGCFHHTGNVQRCFDEAFRVLRPGGVVVAMVYNKYSFRQWRNWPFLTFKDLLRDWGILRSPAKATREQRAASDANAAGDAAPETAFLSVRDMHKILHRYDNVKVQKQNADHFFMFNRWLIDRNRLLSTLGRWLGLDLYVEATKSNTLPITNAAHSATAPQAQAG